MDMTRRQALLGAVFGAGWVGLRALATGLPASFLLSPRRALADGCAASTAQYLILSTSGSGDPLNANVPGTYLNSAIAHPADPKMAPTDFTLGGRTVRAALPWSTLPASVLARTNFFHHTTLTNNHTNEPKVLELMGSVKRQEMVLTLYAKNLASCLGTIQTEPVAVGTETLTYEGRSLPRLSPSGLKAALANPAGPLANLQQLRDSDLDRLNALFKANGTQAERDFLDRMALSQTEVRSISQQLLNSLSAINADDAANQVIASAALVKMNVSPVVTLHIPFGGDNHSDANLANETTQTVSGVATIGALMQQLTTLGLQDKVTFASINVFGRTLSNRGTTGRDHLANHHVTVMIGKGVKAGVIGGLEPKGNDFTAQAIDATSGAGLPATSASAPGVIAFGDTLGAMGKTLGAALGVPVSALDDNIANGQVVQAALV